jgi:predicted enzyme related to lactoylglutathione lyase
MRNAVNWFEIPVTDFSRAKKFYETILACTLHEQQMGPYQMGFFPADTGAASGAIVLGEGYAPSQTGTLVYLNADGILDDVLGRIEKAGGKIVTPKMLVNEDIGHVATFNDSEGNRMALHAPNRNK